MIKKIRLLQVIPSMGIGGAETGCRHVADYISEHCELSSILTSGGSQLSSIAKNVKIFKWPVSNELFYMTSYQFDKDDDQNLSPNRLVRLVMGWS